jgi:hypothetical protein
VASIEGTIYWYMYFTLSANLTSVMIREVVIGERGFIRGTVLYIFIQNYLLTRYLRHPG